MNPTSSLALRRLLRVLALVGSLIGLAGCQQIIKNLSGAQTYPHVPANPSSSQTTYDTSSP